MTQRHNSAHNHLHQPQQQGLTTKRLAYTLPAQSLCLLSSVSLLSGGLAVAQTETSIDNIVPTIENAQPAAGTITVKKDIVIPEASPTQPKFSQRRASLKQRLRKQEVAETRQSQPKPESTEPVFSVRQSQPQVETSRVAPTKNPEVKPKVAETPRVTPTKDPEVATPTPSLRDNLPAFAKPANNGVAAEQTRDFNNAYIDPNDYSDKTAGTYQAPNSVIITERSSGCRTVLSSGQGIGNACAKPADNQPVANSSGKSSPSWLRRSQNAQLATVPPARRLLATNNNARWGNSGVAAAGSTKASYHPNRFIPNPSNFVSTTTVSATPIAPSGGTLPPPMAEGNVAPRVSTVAYDIPLASVLPQIPYANTIAYRGTGMVYPLAVASPITSLFGWRVHPITGNQRFHAGTDLGAPTGTPVLAAARGQVATSDWVGGYGLTVILNHGSAQQTLYGHMSELLVQPGQWVEPGMVIGRVGSTGNSTGPHLHFEVRHLTQNGWVAVDPGVQLQIALSQLLNSSRTARAIRD
ncbi:Peptidase M23B [Trichormus variabilis ATCC 29413]|uniref:Peptidase M23B n=2 Tax=Anabaena variabilis TaxID=264691 RepID=Q3MD96_TRIV2|nr:MULTISPECIES: peptidoglycan DD-metalloendopeptidase family protein [Nostocaceae]ABA21040.1 Peptidase M23B [Trichormus variabilis ATCC 29413]MBC1216201.1 peptidoglycan DD-metalloendopeptidase family protein [Trichormus variabilis ARAD]MBC1255796.1 peptidoglycan DD-metalloendopeptidase family protein [Trichormus variabilis V5]MBC1268631.1 peptidoglycan DD-metalloendopeptidase family protein [Trichormus variabilis FSR]MBC1304664.1 peptidoglycan DD-metalloendopeptidase family protein [Trichormu